MAKSTPLITGSTATMQSRRSNTNSRYYYILTPSRCKANRRQKRTEGKGSIPGLEAASTLLAVWGGSVAVLTRRWAIPAPSVVDCAQGGAVHDPHGSPLHQSWSPDLKRPHGWMSAMVTPMDSRACRQGCRRARFSNWAAYRHWLRLGLTRDVDFPFYGRAWQPAGQGAHGGSIVTNRGRDLPGEDL
jgi:hypothetical protein